MTTAVYPARIRRDDGVYSVQFLDLENGFTLDSTVDEARDMAADVLSALLASFIEHGEAIPTPSSVAGQDINLIAPDAKVQAALVLRAARASRSQGEVAEAMGTTWQARQKIERPDADTTLSKLQKAAKALGKRLVIELR